MPTDAVVNLGQVTGPVDPTTDNGRVVGEGLVAISCIKATTTKNTRRVTTGRVVTTTADRSVFSTGGIEMSADHGRSFS